MRLVEWAEVAGAKMNRISNQDVAAKFRAYPDDVRSRLEHLRRLILDVAANSPEVCEVEETMKWGEPSYLVAGGSTVRLGWKASRPEQYSLLFNCNTKLVDTFKEVYSSLLSFEGNRAIVFHRDDTVPAAAVKYCITLSLTYHSVKHLPLLGA